MNFAHVKHPHGSATLADGVWTSKNPSLALWLNSVASSLEDACRYGCTRDDATPSAKPSAPPASEAA